MREREIHCDELMQFISIELFLSELPRLKRKKNDSNGNLENKTKSKQTLVEKLCKQ